MTPKTWTNTPATKREQLARKRLVSAKRYLAMGGSLERAAAYAGLTPAALDKALWYALGRKL